MTLKRKDLLQTASMLLQDEATAVPPKLLRRSPCALLPPLRERRAPPGTVGIDNLVSRRRIVTAARSPLSRAAAQAWAESVQPLVTKTVVRNKNNKWSDPMQQQQTRWPNVEEVERALDGCCLEDALPWTKADAHNNGANNSKSHHQSPLETYTSAMPCDQQQPPPPDLVRISTSAILSQQNAIWHQIQLEKEKDGAGTTATTVIHSNNNKDNSSDSQQHLLGSSQHTLNSSYSSSSSTHQQPPLRFEPEHDLVVELTTPRSAGKKAYVSPSPSSSSSSTPIDATSSPSSSVRRYQGHSTFSCSSSNNKKVTFAPPRSSSSSHSRNNNNNNNKKPTAPSVVTHHNSHQHPRARPKRQHAASEQHEQPWVYVPCPICQAPLKLSKTPPAERRMGIHCYNCNSSAPSDLIRSYIGGASYCDNNNNNTEGNTTTTNPAL